MKKSISLFMIILIVLSFLSSSVNAAPVKYEVTGVISKLYYQSESGYYVVHTKKNSKGNSWVLDLVRISTKKENKILTNQLKNMYIGKTVHIVYIGDQQTDEEIEIIDTWIE